MKERGRFFAAMKLLLSFTAGLLVGHRSWSWSGTDGLPPSPTLPAPPAGVEQIRDSLLRVWADKLGLNPELVVAVARVENPTADTMARSASGAFGLMQIMPSLWMGRFHNACGGSDLVKIEINVCYGVHILALAAKRCQAHPRPEACMLWRYNGATTRETRLAYLRAVEKARRSED
jgi:soluble lytic murein transglycosylase-like protein